MRPLDWFGPIFGWEMTAVSRRSRYFWVRALFAAIVLFVLWMSYSSVYWTTAWASRMHERASPIRFYAEFASDFFEKLCFVQVTAVLFLTPAYVATSVAVEKQRRTIEYLFATDLTNREIILGKWGARSLNVGMLLLSGVPVLAFASFFGGIELERLLLLSVVTLNTLLATAALSIFASAFSTNVRSALSSAYSMLVLLLLAPLLLVAAIEVGLALARVAGNSGIHEPKIPFFEPWTWRALERWIFTHVVPVIQPYGTFLYILEVSAAGGNAASWRLVGFQSLALGLFTGLVLLVSIARLRSSFRKYVSQGSSARAESAPKVEGPAVVATRSPGQWPLFWKEWHFGAHRKTGCASKILLVIAVLALYYPLGHAFFELVDWNNARANRVWNGEAFNIYLRIMGTLLFLLGFVETTNRAASSIGIERDKDCWVSLLSTPLTRNEILYGKFFAAAKPMRMFTLLLAPVWLYGLMVDGLSIFAIPVLLVTAAIYAAFFASVGVYQSLARKTTGGAIGMSMTILALACGGMQVLSSIVWLPLAIFGSRPPAFLSVVFIGSIPWATLGALAFRNRQRMSEFDQVEVVVGCGFTVLCYAGATLFMLELAKARFAALTERTE